MRSTILVLVLTGFLLVACLAGALGSGVVVLAAEGSTAPATSDIGDLRGAAVPGLWRAVESGVVTNCPAVPWSVLGALGWIVDGSGRRSPVGPPPWWPWPGGTFGITPEGSPRHLPSLPEEAAHAAVELCRAVSTTGSLASALTAITGETRWATEIMGVATALGVAPTLSAGRAGVIEFAARSIGLPYRWGGNGPDAYDCSGLVVAAFASIGRSLPRTAQAQFDVSLARVGSEVPGDLVFFGSSTADVSHVGIVLGDGLMIDAPHTGAFVRIEPHDWPDLVGIASPSG